MNSNTDVSTKEELFEDNNKLFMGLGNLKQEHLKESVLVIQANRRIPLALRDCLKAELDRMVSSGIIEKINETTE